MKHKKCLGIWMDHSHANLIEFPLEITEVITVTSEFTHQAKMESLHNGELHMHNKEKQLQAHYYDHLADIIAGYDSVVLFGPTEAKSELFNIIKSKPTNEHIKVELFNSEKMTDNQRHAFVRDYFL